MIAAHAAPQGAGAVASRRIEAELAELDDEDAAAMRAELGMSESGLDRVVHGAFGLLEPDRLLHAGGGQAGAAPASAAGTDGLACGRVDPTGHPEGFVRAEVIGWQALVDAGGYAGARERGDAASGGAGLCDGGMGT